MTGRGACLAARPRVCWNPNLKNKIGFSQGEPPGPRNRPKTRAYRRKLGACGTTPATETPILAKAGVCGPAAKSGTALAIIPLPIGCAASPVRRPGGRHGGARLCASRTSDCLSLQHARSIIAAALFARKVGRRLNRHITVHWEAAGVRDALAAAATTAFLKYLREWLGGATAYVWARENGDGKGSHVHILAHIPAGRRLAGALSRRWLERIGKQPYRRGTIRTVLVRGSGEPDGLVYAANLQAVLAYVLKGIDPDAAAVLGISPEPGGQVVGKRCGTSRNIGAKARRGALGSRHHE